jgi:hypothetical protein
MGLVLLIVIISIFLYNSGKGYDLLLDNQTVILGGIEYPAKGTVRVYIDNQDPLDLWIDDRDVSSVMGKEHTMRVELLDEAEEKVLQSREETFTIDPKKGTLFSMPGFLGGSQEWVMSME